jgi:hypothetical protein
MRAALPVLSLLLAACAYVDARSTPYADVPKFAAVDPADVQVLAAEPKRRHDRLGEVLVYTSMDPAPPPALIDQRLREEAAKWGANAVYVMRDMERVANERHTVGIAIRYR